MFAFQAGWDGLSHRRLPPVYWFFAFGCGAFSLPSLSKSTSTPQTSSGTWQRSSDEIHGLPVRGENIGVEVGNHVPPFSLGLADGSIITSEGTLGHLATDVPLFLGHHLTGLHG